MSYQNQHSLSQPYWNFLPSSLIFYPREICLIVAFVFIQLTCNNTIRSVCLSERREWKAKRFFHTQKRTYNSQSTTKKQILLKSTHIDITFKQCKAKVSAKKCCSYITRAFLYVKVACSKLLGLKKTCLLFFMVKLINLFVSFFGPGEGQGNPNFHEDETKHRSRMWYIVRMS